MFGLRHEKQKPKKTGTAGECGGRTERMQNLGQNEMHADRAKIDAKSRREPRITVRGLV